MSHPDNTLRPRNAGGSAPGRATGGAGSGGSGGSGGSSGTAADEQDLAEGGTGPEGEDEEGGAMEVEGESFVDETDWERVGIFGAGLAIGALLGAGVALLLAPQSGADTRDAIVTRVRGVRNRVRDGAANTWDDLGEELRRVSRRSRKRMRRGLTRSRWAAADAIDRD